MPAPVCPDDLFAELVRRHGPAEAARRLGVSERSVHNRRLRLERRTGEPIIGPPHPAQPQARTSPRHVGRLHAEVPDGVVLIGSDAHYWPGEASTAHRAFVLMCKRLKPALVVCNGDAFDGASISRHPPIGWEERPSVIQEIEACQERLGEIEQAAGKARKVWTLGNHDSRFAARLAAVAPEYAKVHGLRLEDHFPFWEFGWSCWINDDVVVKHRHRGGIHAAHNNTLHAGMTTVTGHLHSLKVTPVTDYRSTRWGIDCGSLADPWGPQFSYAEDNPRNWRSGFVVLTFRDSRLLWPEVCHVVDEGRVEFRGELIEV